MAILNMVQAINLALRQEMERDEKVVLLGQDIGINGGVFRVTDGLWKQFGDSRVMDTPLAEAGIIGTSIGLAMTGFKPVAEIQFDGFFYPGFDQVISHAARMRNRTRGVLTCPLVVRMPYGGGVRALEHHSESMEAIFAHTPGIKVVIPSTPREAKGLLASAIRDPDPVVFLEPKRIYRAIKEEVPDGEFLIPIGKANIVKQGNQVTLVSYGAMLWVCQKALEQLKGKYSVEVIDLRTVSPLDSDTILSSVKKTGRCVIVQEGPRSFGVAAEIIAQINEKALFELQAPVERVTGHDIILPYYKNELNCIPSEERIVFAVEKVMKD
ncbi:alpha-ketoacid dehydrogenase subunit beta [Candidatus Woesearchaeota archaeon]|nr:alpha-ketoacid dehydrogenase subunit beta [Candidatus Woesearchaeota archaeon]